MTEQAKNIAFNVLKYLAPSGDKAGRYIYVDFWRNELVNYIAQKLEIEVTDDLRLIVETELKSAWQNILELRECRD
ncbi:MAG: hypothetical protein MET45_10885 [Nostoc sp. LLA-1]|nr:hypothetical protein [Cyanocohniella sp. LLY]